MKWGKMVGGLASQPIAAAAPVLAQVSIRLADSAGATNSLEIEMVARRRAGIW